jgi:hypothetical protein
LDPRVVGLFYEHGDLLGRLIEKLRDRGSDDHSDRQLQFTGGVAEFGQQLVRQAEAADAA